MWDLFTKILDIIPCVRIKLEGDIQSRIIRILKKSGWFSGRSVDISKVRSYYAEQGIELTEAAEAFFREYYGLAGDWYIETKNLKYASDVIFHLFPDGDECDVLDRMFDDAEYTLGSEDYKAVREYADNSVILVGEVGYTASPLSVYIGKNGKFYCYEYISGEYSVREYETIVQVIEAGCRGLKFESAAVK